VKVYCYADGAAQGSPGPAGIGGVIYDEQGAVLAKLSEPIGIADSALAEWHALVEVLKLARQLGATDVELNLDELGIVDALCDAATIRAPHLVPYYEKARELMAQFASCDILHVLRTGNTVADDLAGGAAGANPNYRRLKRNSQRIWEQRKARYQ
jgi:ribonuclease HI